MIALPKAQAKAVKLFCSDKDRPILHARYKVENSIAACTNGHIAAYWPTAEANGVYSLAGEGLQAEMPGCLAVLPAREQSISKAARTPSAAQGEQKRPCWDCVVQARKYAVLGSACARRLS